MKRAKGLSRREFCAASAAAAFAAASRSGRARAAACNGPIAAGSVSSVAVGAYKPIASYNVFVCRDAQGLFAMSSACTHSGCTVQVQTTQLYCPCHGATFDLNGQNPTTPATTALPHYALSIDAAGNIYIDNGKPVAPGTRAT